MKILLVLFLLYCVYCENIQVQTKTGIIEGFQNATGKYFFGVPFGEAPVGEARFRAPQPKKPWNGVLQTKEPGPMCIQPSSRPHQSEDCLFLNVHAPSNNLTGLPVLIWFYGGSFVFGQGDIYDGDSLSKDQNVIVVTVNYRLGLFGFMYAFELNQEGPSGLYGVLDQRTAIQWTIDNIAQFGGDPQKITLFGESAGATSVLFHVVSPKTPRFARAIVQSGPLSYYTQDRARYIFTEAIRKLNCGQNVPSCLRSHNVSEILKVQRSITTFSVKDAPLFRPVLHPEEFPIPFHLAFQQGKFRQVPILMGANLNEASYFLCPGQENLNLAQYYAFLGYEFGFERATKIATKYNANQYPSPKWALSHVLSDFIFKCPALEMMHHTSKHVGSYLYSFEFLAGFASKCHGVAHGYELPFLFNQFAGKIFKGYELSRAEMEFSLIMKKMWGDFSRGATQHWNKFDGAKNNYFLMNATITESNQFRGDHCAFWKSLNIPQ